MVIPLIRCNLVVLLLMTFALGDQRIIDRYESGKKKREYTLDSKDERHGRYIEYFENGKRKLSCSYLHGKLNGKYLEYQSDGKKKVEKTYKNDEPTGFSLRYDDKGNVAQRICFAGGQVFSGPSHGWKSALSPDAGSLAPGVTLRIGRAAATGPART